MEITFSHTRIKTKNKNQRKTLKIQTTDTKRFAVTEKLSDDDDRFGGTDWLNGPRAELRWAELSGAVDKIPDR